MTLLENGRKSEEENYSGGFLAMEFGEGEEEEVGGGREMEECAFF